MGCVSSNCLCQNQPTLSKSSDTENNELSEINDLNQSRYRPQSQSQDDPLYVQFHTPIYVAVCSNYTTKDTYISFELGNEMELIEEINSSELRINHLRSGRCGIVPKVSVQLDEATALRLAVEDTGITQRCLMQHSTPGAYLIRCSTTQPKAFVMCISQFNGQCNTFHWNYLICIHASNNFFYFSQKEQLKHLFFSSFQQIICNEHVRSIGLVRNFLPCFFKFYFFSF